MRSPRGLVGRLSGTWRLVLKELSAFGTVGAACFVLDVGLLQLLYAHVGLGAVTAKVLSTLVSMTVAFFAHRYWSFSHRARKNPRRQYLQFALINGATLLLGVAIVAFVRYPLGQDSVLIVQIANVGSIILGTVLRYFSYRRWVFPARTGTVPAGSAHDGPLSPNAPSPDTRSSDGQPAEPRLAA